MALTAIQTALKPFGAIVPWKSKGTYRYTKDQLTEPKYFFKMKSLFASKWKTLN